MINEHKTLDTFNNLWYIQYVEYTIRGGTAY